MLLLILPKFFMTNRGLSITLRMLPWSKDTYVVLLPVARTSSTRTENKIFLRRLYLHDQFARMCTRESLLFPSTPDYLAQEITQWLCTVPPRPATGPNPVGT